MVGILEGREDGKARTLYHQVLEWDSRLAYLWGSRWGIPQT